MPGTREYFVYILSNRQGTLYTGVTNDLVRRLAEHKGKINAGFTSRYDVSRLVFYESTEEIAVALAREKQIKGWLRSKKVALIRSMNPDWRDLSDGWFEDGILRSAQNDKR